MTVCLTTHLVIANIQKRRNIRALIETALAFGVTSLLIVGQPSLDLGSPSASDPRPSNSLALHLRRALILCTDDDDNVNKDSSSTTTCPQQPPPRGQAYVRRFAKWADCVAYLQRQNMPLVGVEIDARAVTVQDLLRQIEQQKQQPQNYSSSSSLALVMGNEGQGLQPRQLQDCQHIVRLPQYGTGTASYNVYVAASLVLQQLHQYQTTGQIMM